MIKEESHKIMLMEMPLSWELSGSDLKNKFLKVEARMDLGACSRQWRLLTYKIGVGCLDVLRQG